MLKTLANGSHARQGEDVGQGPRAGRATTALFE